MGRLILVRHGESVGNVERVFTTTPFELALTERGIEQARDAAAAIARLFRAEAVVASPYVRARETARIIAEHLGLPLQIEHDIHERNMGGFQGKSYESILTAQDYDPQRPWLWKPPGGESFEDVMERVAPVLDRLSRAHRERDVVVVSHGGVMMALWAYVTGEWESAHVPVNCGIVVIEHREEGGYQRPVVIGAQRSADSTGG